MSRRVLRATFPAAALALGIGSAPHLASAQQYLYGASASASSGLEGSSYGSSGPTRLRARIGLDLRVDEFPEDVAELDMLAEIQPHSSFGADARYGRMIGDRFLASAGVIGIVAPASLYGVCAGITYRLPIASHVQVTLEPEADFYVLGSDLPDGTVIWQVRVSGGLRVDL